MTIEPYYADDTIVIYHGDALEVLESIELSDIAAVITDPPYSSGSRKEADKPGRGAMIRGARFVTPIDNDRMTTTGFVWLMREVTLRLYPHLVEGASVLSFIDWRQWPNLVGALESCNLRVQNMVIWDKGAIGMGNGFRNQHELVCHAAKGVPNVHDRSTPNVLTAGRITPDDHPSPKPASLLDRLLRVVTGPGDLIVDPFMGTARPLRAVKDSGRRGIGIEKDESYCETAALRLSQESLNFEELA